MNATTAFDLANVLDYEVVLVSKSGCHYKGKLCAIDSQKLTVSLGEVTILPASPKGNATGANSCFTKIAESGHVFDRIDFKSSNLEDLKVVSTSRAPRHSGLGPGAGGAGSSPPRPNLGGGGGKDISPEMLMLASAVSHAAGEKVSVVKDPAVLYLGKDISTTTERTQLTPPRLMRAAPLTSMQQEKVPYPVNYFRQPLFDNGRYQQQQAPPQPQQPPQRRVYLGDPTQAYHHHQHHYPSRGSGYMMENEAAYRGNPPAHVSSTSSRNLSNHQQPSQRRGENNSNSLGSQQLSYYYNPSMRSGRSGGGSLSMMGKPYPYHPYGGGGGNWSRHSVPGPAGYKGERCNNYFHHNKYMEPPPMYFSYYANSGARVSYGSVPPAPSHGGYFNHPRRYQGENQQQVSAAGNKGGAGKAAGGVEDEFKKMGAKGEGPTKTTTNQRSSSTAARKVAANYDFEAMNRQLQEILEKEVLPKQRELAAACQAEDPGSQLNTSAGEESTKTEQEDSQQGDRSLNHSSGSLPSPAQNTAVHAAFARLSGFFDDFSLVASGPPGGDTKRWHNSKLNRETFGEPFIRRRSSLGCGMRGSIASQLRNSKRSSRTSEKLMIEVTNNNLVCA